MYGERTGCCFQMLCVMCVYGDGKIHLLPPFLQVSECSWPIRQAPSLHNLFAVCRNMYNWLLQNPKNVCVVHCLVSIFWSFAGEALVKYGQLYPEGQPLSSTAFTEPLLEVEQCQAGKK